MSASASTDSLPSSGGDAVEEDILAQQEQSQAPKESEDPSALEEDLGLDPEAAEAEVSEESEPPEMEAPDEELDPAESAELDENC